MALESSNCRLRSAWYHSRPSHGAPRRPRVDVEPQGQAPERGALRAALPEGDPSVARLGGYPHQPDLSPLLLELRPRPAAPGDASSSEGPGLLHLLARRAPQADGPRRQGHPTREPDRVLPPEPDHGLYLRRLRLRHARPRAEIPRGHERALRRRVSEGDSLDGVHAGGQSLSLLSAGRHDEMGADQAWRAGAAAPADGHLRDHPLGESAAGRRYALPRLPAGPRHHVLG